jgi:hypothetical protein
MLATLFSLGLTWKAAALARATCAVPTVGATGHPVAGALEAGGVAAGLCTPTLTFVGA